MNAPLTAEAEAVARRVWAWLGQVQSDRSLPASALSTAFVVMRGRVDGIDTVDVAAARAYLAERDCPLDSDVRALVAAGHLVWRVYGEGFARSAMRMRKRGRGRRAGAL